MRDLTVDKKDFQQNQSALKKAQRNLIGKCLTTNTSTTDQSEKDWKKIKTTQIIGQKEGTMKNEGKKTLDDWKKV